MRPTFQTGRGELIEAYLLDFDADLYDEAVKVRFTEWIHGQERFESADALVEQIAEDVEVTRHIASG